MKKHYIFVCDGFRKNGPYYETLVTGAIKLGKDSFFRNAKESFESVEYIAKVNLPGFSLYHNNETGVSYLLRNIADGDGVKGDIIHVSDEILESMKYYYFGSGIKYSHIRLSCSCLLKEITVTIFTSNYTLEDVKTFPEFVYVDDGDYINEIFYEENKQALQNIQQMVSAN